MRALFLIPLVFAFLKTAVLACNRKEDCPEYETCVADTCVKCVTCSLLFREGDSCITDFNECGDCLEGYEEISQTEYSTAKKSCKPIDKKECHNCPPNTYCSNGSCIKCFECATVNRLQPLKCVTDWTECGPCSDGYYETAPTLHINSWHCEQTSPDIEETLMCDFSLNTYAIMFVALLAVIIFSVIYVKKCKCCQKYVNFVKHLRRPVSSTTQDHSKDNSCPANGTTKDHSKDNSCPANDLEKVTVAKAGDFEATDQHSKDNSCPANDLEIVTVAKTGDFEATDQHSKDNS